jgi:4-hydroxy-2-oxoheptanedioate aldolase
MDELKKILLNLKELGCCGIKISYEDEGALLNEVISMRYLTSSIGVNLSIKIGGCEAKRDIVDCLNISCDSIVAPMIESGFALNKFSKSLNQYNYCGEKGFNLETINAYKNLEEISSEFSCIDYVTVGRVDFASSLNKDRSFVNEEQMYEMVKNVFIKAKEFGKKCYLGGAISIASKDFIKRLIDEDLIDKFETRYIIFDVNKINFEDYEKLLYFANIFEVEWLKFISARYGKLFNKDTDRISMMEERINSNKQ